MTDGPALENTSFESVWTHSGDGLTLHARLYGTPSPGQLPVVCLPGLTRNAAEFHHLAGLLLADGSASQILAVDYRGRGLSDRDPDPTHYSIPVETADLLLLLRDREVDAAAFIGVSRGGLISMGLGAHRPDLVRGIVLNDIGPVVDRAGLMRIKGYVGRLGAPADLPEAAQLLQTRFRDQFPNLTEPDWLGWAETVWKSQDGRLIADYDPALARTLDGIDDEAPIADLWPVFDALGGIPMMVIRGGTSDLLSGATVAEMARRHPGLDVVEVADEGHTPLLHRPALARRIGAFLTRLNAG